MTEPAPLTADPLPEPSATNLDEAIERLHAGQLADGTYPTGLVEDVLHQIDAGAEAVATAERDRWARWFEHVGANGRHLSEVVRAGSRYAAAQLRLNSARTTREGTHPS